MKLLVMLAIAISAFVLRPSDAYIIHANVSAYTHSGNVMANGEMPHKGAVAADDLPIGTKVKINGKIYTVKDRFGGGYHNRIDIFMETYEECIKFGRRYIDVEVLEKGENNVKTSRAKRLYEFRQLFRCDGQLLREGLLARELKKSTKVRASELIRTLARINENKMQPESIGTA